MLLQNSITSVGESSYASQQKHRADYGNLMAVSDTTAFPGDDCCTLYNTYNFSGENVNLCLKDGQTTTYDLADYDFARLMDSWWCGRNIAYRICGSYECDAENFLSGGGSQFSPGVSTLDVAVQLILYPYDNRQLGGVTLFKDQACRGSTGLFHASSNLYEKVGYMS